MSVREDEIDDSSAPLIEHLAELRTRLIWSVLAFVVALCAVFVVYNPIFNFLARPVCQAMAKHGQECALVMIKLQEGFFVAIRIAFLGGFVLSFPIIGYQLWRFVAPGLYRTEKRAFLPFLIASPFMFVLGAAFAYYIILPMAFDFFLGFQQGALGDAPSEGAEALQRAGILYQGSIEEYLALTIKFVLAFGLCFQLPVLLTLMGKAGLVSADGMASVRKYAIVGILILAAIATPPDVISQIVLFSVVCGLYEISILLVRRIEKRRAAEEAAADAELFGTAPAAGPGTEAGPEAATETGAGAGTGPVEEPAQTVSEAAMLADTAGQGPGEAAGETADPDPGTLPDEEQGDEADIAEGDAGAELAGHGPASAGIGSAGDESAGIGSSGIGSAGDGDEDAGNAGDEDRSAGAGDENDVSDEGEEPKP